MIRASTLRGKAVVDLDAATKIGEIDGIILHPEERVVAGFVVTRGQNLLGQGDHVVVPAAAVHALGEDAVTVRGTATHTDTGNLAALPRLTHIVGRKVLTASGRVVGSIHDVLIDPQSGLIVGYALSSASPTSTLGRLFGGGDDDRGEYVRADAELRVGPDLIVVESENDIVRNGAHRTEPALLPRDAALAEPALRAPEARPQEPVIADRPVTVEQWSSAPGGTGLQWRGGETARPETSRWLSDEPVSVGEASSQGRETWLGPPGGPATRAGESLLADPHMGLGDTIPPRRTDGGTESLADDGLERLTERIEPLPTERPVPRDPLDR